MLLMMTLNCIWWLALVCSAGQKSCAGVHHHIHQRGVEDSLQSCRGAPGGSLRPASLTRELGWRHVVMVAGRSCSSLPPWWTPPHPLGPHSGITSSGKALLTPGKARASPSEGCGGRLEERGSKTKFGDDWTILLVLIYIKRLGLEFKLDFRVSAYACFCIFSEMIDFQMFYSGPHAPAASPLMSSESSPCRPVPFWTGAEPKPCVTIEHVRQGSFELRCPVSESTHWISKT